jgi:hypothetical protein
MRITFNEIAARATVRWRDPQTGKPRQRTQKFWQTCNPFNVGADGKPKTAEQIRKEVRDQALLWKLRMENDIRDGKYPL